MRRSHSVTAFSAPTRCRRSAGSDFSSTDCRFAAAPIPASPGKVTRRRLNPGGNREANHALWRIVITRMGSHPATRAYVERRTAEGLSKKEIIRCLRRYVAREACRHLRAA